MMESGRDGLLESPKLASFLQKEEQIVSGRGKQIGAEARQIVGAETDRD